MNIVDVNGIALRYDVQGSGPWLVLCHSLATDLTLWDGQLAALVDRHTVLRFDLRGHGGSSAPAGAYDFPMLTADLLGLLDALAVRQASFVGISLGGMIGQHLALTAPERVRKLILVSTTHGYPPEAAAAFRERARLVQAQGLEALVAPTLERWFTAPNRAERPDVMERIGNLIRATPVAGYAGCCQAIPTLNTRLRLAEIRCPALVMAGREDAGTPPEMGKEIAGAIPGARFALIERASHLCNVEQVETFNLLLRKFLG
jgi:3-oxoadipate enol-lactonase